MRTETSEQTSPSQNRDITALAYRDGGWGEVIPFKVSQAEIDHLAAMGLTFEDAFKRMCAYLMSLPFEEACALVKALIDDGEASLDASDADGQP